MNFTRIKNVAKAIFFETLPHIVACTIISLFNPGQAWIIFIIGLFLPDFLVLFSKLTFYPSERVNGEKIVRYKAFRYNNIKNVVKVFHVLTLLFSVIALIAGHPLIFFAGLSHIVLDMIGY